MFQESYCARSRGPCPSYPGEYKGTINDMNSPIFSSLVLQKSVIECSMFAQMKGEAEAFAIEAKAKAEAEQMAKKADAWKDYQDAAMVDMVLETLPKVRYGSDV